MLEMGIVCIIAVAALILYKDSISIDSVVVFKKK